MQPINIEFDEFRSSEKAMLLVEVLQNNPDLLTCLEEKSISSNTVLTIEPQLPAGIKAQLGPLPSKSGWHVASGICNTCGGHISGTIYEDCNEAIGAVEEIIKRMSMGHIEMLQIFGPINGLCDNCKEIFEYAKKLRKESCDSCADDCGHCSNHRELEELF